MSRFNAVLRWMQRFLPELLCAQAPLWDPVFLGPTYRPRVAQRKSHSITGIAKFAAQNTLPLGWPPLTFPSMLTAS